MSLARGAILLVLDGLRPDFVTPDLMPHLDALAARGVRCTRSRAVWPSVTRINASTIATGCYPAHHGIPDNRFVVREHDATEVLDAGSHEDLARIRAVRDGRVLLRPTLAERVAAAGGAAAIVGTGSPGSSLLHHPDAPEHGHAVYNQALWRGVEQSEVEADLGRMPEGAVPNSAQNEWFTRIITERLLPAGTDLVVFWHTDPDKTQHRYAVGHPEVLAALGEADRNVGRLVAALAGLGLTERYDLVVTSDHGFSTVAAGLGRPRVAEALAAAGFAAGEAVVAGTGVYLADAARAATAAAVLHALEGVGAVFSGARGAPVIEGTLPLEAVGQGGVDCGDLMFSPAWNGEVNEHGRPGLRAGRGPEPASDHGSTSPWEMQNTLILAGPSFAEGVVSDVPAGNVDLAPTLARIVEVDGGGMDGRVLREALRGGPAPTAVTVVDEAIEAERAGGRRQVLQRSLVEDVSYLNGALSG